MLVFLSLLSFLSKALGQQEFYGAWITGYSAAGDVINNHLDYRNQLGGINTLMVYEVDGVGIVNIGYNSASEFWATNNFNGVRKSVSIAGGFIKGFNIKVFQNIYF